MIYQDRRSQKGSTSFSWFLPVSYEGAPPSSCTVNYGPFIWMINTILQSHLKRRKSCVSSIYTPITHLTNLKWLSLSGILKEIIKDCRLKKIRGPFRGGGVKHCFGLICLTIQESGSVYQSFHNQRKWLLGNIQKSLHIQYFSCDTSCILNISI